MGEFNRLTDCIRCKRYIDEETVRLAKLTIGPDTFRRYDLANDPAFKYEKICTECHDGRKAGIPDVYYGYGSGTHTEENICDPATGQPIPFSSKQGKWEAMQKAGVRECGDRVHGARTNFTR